MLGRSKRGEARQPCGDLVAVETREEAAADS